MIIGILIFNATLYVALSKLTHNPQLFQMAKAFPIIISNKKTSGFDYEQD
tara:strand:- start:503 stop:652 length:150 start_codon:yes stop_codon:yes gene_type:complete